MWFPPMPRSCATRTLSDVATFLVERYLAGWEPQEVDDLIRRVGRHAEQFRARGVRHLQSIVLAADETCLCLFEGSDAGSVQFANDEADFPVHRVVPAFLV